MGGPGVQGDRQHGEEPGLAEEEGQVHRKVSDYRVTRQFGERVGFTIIPGAEGGNSRTRRSSPPAGELPRMRTTLNLLTGLKSNPVEKSTY